MTTYLTNRQAMQAYLDGKKLEYLSGRVWHPSNHFTIDYNGLDDPSQYRLAPTTITRTVTYPAPVTEPLKDGDVYWTVYLEHDRLRSRCQWYNDLVDRIRLKRGLVYLTEADAIARAKAMIGGVE